MWLIRRCTFFPSPLKVKGRRHTSVVEYNGHTAKKTNGRRTVLVPSVAELISITDVDNEQRPKDVNNDVSLQFV